MSAPPTGTRVRLASRRGHGPCVHDVRVRGAARGDGFILAGAVPLDATMVRLLLQPVALRLLGPRAWWMPAWLDRLFPKSGLSHEMPEAEPTQEFSIAKRGRRGAQAGGRSGECPVTADPPLG